MRQPSLRRARLAVAVAALAVSVAACGFLGNHQQEVWICLNPDSGLEEGAPYDSTHYVNGVFDPCNCYDPCGPEKSCPIMVDAGPLPTGCDGGAGGSDGGW